MIRTYECIDNPERPIKNNEILTNPKLMADYAKDGRYVSLPVVPMIPICLGVKFENGRTAYPIYDDICDYVDDFLLNFLKEVEKLAGEYKFTLHLCPKSTLAIVDLNKADFEAIDFDNPRKYIDILFDNPSTLMGDRCINLADEEFNKVNKIVLKEDK